MDTNYLWVVKEQSFSGFGDLRRDRRVNTVLEDLFRQGSHSIRQLCGSEAKAKGAYRLLNNSAVSEQRLLENLTAQCQVASAGRSLLCIQDTTEINLIDHRGRIKPDGTLGTTNARSTEGLGFFIHPCLVLDEQSGAPCGFGHIRIWNRDAAFRNKKERNYSKLPIAQKDSYKWIETSEGTIAALADTAQHLRIVQDREGDIYEQWATVPSEKVALLIRAATDRRLADGSRLYGALSQSPLLYTYSLEIAASGGRKKRTAIIEVRTKEVEILRPARADKALPKQIKLYAIEAKEVGGPGKGAIHWRLLSSSAVEDWQQACNSIWWYSLRWTIEEVFRILKKEGFDIEASELGRGSSVRKLSLLMLHTIIRLFLMRFVLKEEEAQGYEPQSCFREEEIAFGRYYIPTLEGKTARQKNPYKENDLRRMAWLIARLGGWKGYESKRYPGITCLWIGLQKFEQAIQGFNLLKNLSTR